MHFKENLCVFVMNSMKTITRENVMKFHKKETLIMKIYAMDVNKSTFFNSK